MKSKRSTLLEFIEVDPNTHPFSTTSNCEEIPTTEEVGKELFEMLKLIYQLRDRRENYCKDCSDKDKCVGCIWRQIHYYIYSAELLMTDFIKLTPVKIPPRPHWMDKENEDFFEKIREYQSVINPGVEICRPGYHLTVNLKTGKAKYVKDK